MKTVAGVNRRIIIALTSDNEMEERAILYREYVTRAEVESIIRQPHLRLPASKGKDWVRLYFRMGLLEVAV